MKIIPLTKHSPMSDQNRLFLKGVGFCIIIAGIMAILFRKSIDLKSIMLFGTSILFCFTLFVGYDYYRYYSGIMKYRSAVAEFAAKNPVDRQFVKDDKLGWKLIENVRIRHYTVTYEIDKDGFRKINNSEERPDFSIYFFGDSFTFGSGVNDKDTFTSIIKDKYLKKEIDVYNTGVDGYGIVQMFQRFLSLKDQIQPGDLIIFTPIANDIKRNLTDFYIPYATKFANIMTIGKYPFFDQGVMTYHELEDNFYNKLKLSAISAPYTGYFFKSIRNKFIPDTTKESQEIFKIIEKETEMRGGKFILFFLPETGERLYRTYTVDISGFNYFDIMHFFPSEAEELNKMRLSKDDGHYNKTGHEIVAKAIVETLINERIIPERYLNVKLKEKISAKREGLAE